MLAVYVLVALAAIAGQAQAGAPWDRAAGCTDACFKTAVDCFDGCKGEECETDCGNTFIGCNCDCKRHLPCRLGNCEPLKPRTKTTGAGESYMCFMEASDAVNSCKEPCKTNVCRMRCYRKYYDDICSC